VPGTILLVDDNHEILTGVRMRLGAVGYQTRTACDGQTGIQSAIQHPPDAIVMDVRMPGIDGLQAVAELQCRPDTKDIPIIVLSASLADEESALDAGAHFFVKKPYVGTELIAAIRAAVGLKSVPSQGGSE